MKAACYRVSHSLTHIRSLTHISWQLIVPYYPTRTLFSQDAGLLVDAIESSLMGARAFSYQAPLQWNQVPLWIWEVDTISTFKSFLFDIKLGLPRASSELKKNLRGHQIPLLHKKSTYFQVFLKNVLSSFEKYWTLLEACKNHLNESLLLLQYC